MSNAKPIVFTGGHHTSALVVAKKLQEEGIPVVWFGHRRSMWGDTSDSAEYREVTQAGIKFYDLKTGKFYKTFNPLKLIRIPIGFFHSLSLLLLLRPRGIVSFGGYLAVPTVITGWLLGIPSITHEQTLTSGWANKLIAIFVNKIAVSWPQTADFFPKSKVIVTGLPLRPEILHLHRSPITDHRLTIYVTGGKNGSRTINLVVFSLLPQLIKAFRIIHQTGHHDLSQARSLKLQNYEAFDYDSAKALEALAVCDLVISRAGAHIIYELAVLGKPSVIIPIPWSSRDEQMKNAKILSSRGLAVILPQDELSPASLMAAITKAQSLKPQQFKLATDGTPPMTHLIKKEFKV